MNISIILLLLSTFSFHAARAEILFNNRIDEWDDEGKKKTRKQENNNKIITLSLNSIFIQPSISVVVRRRTRV
jgi:hypothetical protein